MLDFADSANNIKFTVLYPTGYTGIYVGQFFTPTSLTVTL